MDQQPKRLGITVDDTSSNAGDSEGKELNGNNVKRMNTQEKRSKMSGKKSSRHRISPSVDTNNMSQFTPSHWTMNHAQRQPQPHLYPAMSDPSVCSYQIPISFPMESVSFPFYSVYQSPVMPEMRKQSPHFPFGRVPTQSRLMNNTYFRQSDNYTSLPPVPPPEATEDHQRRFSDPGLGNVDDSDLESTSSCSDYSLPPSSSKLMDQLTAVNNEVQRLSCQLSQTQSELVDVKLDMVSLKNSFASKYEQPGLVTEMISEIKKAAEIREKAFLSQISSLISAINSKNSGLNQSNECVNSCEKLDQFLVPSSDFEIDATRRIVEVEKKCALLEQALSDAVSARLKAENEAEVWKNKLISISKETPVDSKLSTGKDCEILAFDLSTIQLEGMPKENYTYGTRLKVSNCDQSSSGSDVSQNISDFNKNINADSTDIVESSPSKILNSKNYSRKLSSGLEILDHLDDHALGPVTDL